MRVGADESCNSAEEIKIFLTVVAVTPTGVS
jgi:hypothetical protein